jgi:hypothetical protein
MKVFDYNETMKEPFDGIYYNMPEKVYRPAAGISFTTVVRNLIIDSPSRAKWLMENPTDPTDAMILGSAFDCLIFRPGDFDSEFGILPEGCNLRTNKGKEEKADIELSGRKPIKMSDYNTLCTMSANVHMHEQCKDLFDLCKFQVAVFWVDNKTGVKCKGLLDMYAPPPLGFLLDIKTCGPVPGPSSYNLVNTFQKQYEDKFYDGQLTYYKRGIESHIDGDLINEVGFIVVSKVPPFDVIFYDVDHDDIDYSNAQIDIALTKYRELESQTVWPAYPERRRISRRPFARKGLESELIGETI